MEKNKQASVVRIESDWAPAHTRVILDDGRELANITSVGWEVDASGDPSTVTITLYAYDVKVVCG